MAEHEQDDPVASDEDSGKHKVPSAIYDGVEASPMPPLAHDGGPILSLDPPLAIPAATPEQFVCLRGPCRHYWEMQTFIAAGNPAGTWGEDGLKDEHGDALEAPRSVLRTCLVHPGTETDLTDELVFRCNKWDPMTPSELKKREKRRSPLLKMFGG